MSFYRGAFYKSAEVINMLCDELDKEKKSGKETKLVFAACVVIFGILTR